MWFNVILVWEYIEEFQVVGRDFRIVTWHCSTLEEARAASEEFEKLWQRPPEPDTRVFIGIYWIDAGNDVVVEQERRILENGCPVFHEEPKKESRMKRVIRHVVQRSCCVGAPAGLGGGEPRVHGGGLVLDAGDGQVRGGSGGEELAEEVS